FATLTFPSDHDMVAEEVTATQVAVGLQSNGFISFRGTLTEGNVTGDNYVIACALVSITDSSGATPVIATNGNVSGTLNIGGNNSVNFQIDRFEQAISD